MIIKLLKLMFGKVVGLDNIPKEKKEIFWQKLGDYSTKLAGEMAEGTVRGLKDGSNDK